MGIVRKKKICRTCETEQYIWADGNCKRCSVLLKFSSDPQCLGVVIAHQERYKADIVKLDKKVRRQEEKSVQELLKLATIVFNKFIRQRDSENDRFRCICCLEWVHTDFMDAGHYMSAGKHPATRFDEENVHGCCQRCNRFMEGNLDQYRINLHAKIGTERLYNLELKARAIYKWDRLALMELINNYKLKIKTDD